MSIFEYMLIEVAYGVERDLSTLRMKDLKTFDDFKRICEAPIYRKAFLVAYNLFPKIESLSEGEKKDLWGMTKRLFPGKGKEELIENCKIIYTGGKLI